MNPLIILFPYLLACAIGYFLLFIIFHKEKPMPFFLSIFFAGGLGAGVCAYIIFLSFLIYGYLNGFFGMIYSIILLTGLTFISTNLKSKTKHPLFNKKSFCWPQFQFLGILIILLIPVWIQANYYEYGGWDAWSVWNFKAKLLFLSGENWKDMFNPMLWRSSPHYPLLLPLINVWGWIFQNQAINNIPILTGFIFTFLTLGLLSFGLRELTKNAWSIIPSALLATSPLFVQLTTSQYSDIVVGFYLLAGFFSLIQAKEQNSSGYSLLAGLMIGFLTFTKSEGQLAALILSLLAVIFFMIQSRSGHKRNLILSFILGLALTSWPTIIFYLKFSSPNITFTNGLMSSIKPSSLERLKYIFAFSFFELINWKWRGLWIAIFLGIILSFKKCFHAKVNIIPIFLSIYASATAFYYLINTYFEIEWWMQVTISRLLFAILPTVLFWVLYSALGEKKEKC